MSRITARRILRRAVALGALALPCSISPSIASAPMGDDELGEMLRLCGEARKAIAREVDKSAIARMSIQRNADLRRIFTPSGGLFMSWPATAKEARSTEVTGLLYRVELDQAVSLITAFRDHEKLAKVALASLNKAVRISGAISTRSGAPIEVPGVTNTEAEICVLAKITAID